MFSALIDVHRNISAAQCFFRYFASDSVNQMEIIVKSNCIIVRFLEDLILRRQLKVIVPNNYFIPTSIRNVDRSFINAECSLDGCYVRILYEIQAAETSVRYSKPRVLEASFRLQITDLNIIERTILRIDNNRKYKGFLKSFVETGVLYDIICTDCNSPLNSKPIIFDKVKEYHDRYSELAEAWFCHRLNPAATELKADTLYVSDVLFYFHLGIMKQLLLEVKDQEYTCTMCSSVLSPPRRSASSRCIGFFCDKIMFRKLQEEVDILEYKKKTALKCLCVFVENCLHSSVFCKMVLHGKIDHKNLCILMWISPQKVANFFLEAPLDEIPADIDMEVNEVYKAFYSTTELESDASQTWSHSFQVEYYLISDNMFYVICEQLGQSTKNLPTFQKDKFSFAYISTNTIF